MKTNCHIYCLPFPRPLFAFTLPILLVFSFPFLSSLSRFFPPTHFLVLLCTPFSLFRLLSIPHSPLLFSFLLPIFFTQHCLLRSARPIVRDYWPTTSIFPSLCHSISPFPPFPLHLFHSHSHHLSRPSNINCHSRPPGPLLEI